jgi:hypothetical protein
VDCMHGPAGSQPCRPLPGPCPALVRPHRRLTGSAGSLAFRPVPRTHWEGRRFGQLVPFLVPGTSNRGKSGAGRGIMAPFRNLTTRRTASSRCHRAADGVQCGGSRGLGPPPARMTFSRIHLEFTPGELDRKTERTIR